MNHIRANDFIQWHSENQPFVLDVRTEMEFSMGHLKNSVLIPVDQLESRIDELPSKDTQILVVCAHGVRSVYAGSILESQGFSAVFNLEGGLASLNFAP